MKLYLTITLVALLFSFGACVPKTNLKTAATEEVVVQHQETAEVDLDENVVDNSVLSNLNEESVLNTVNLLENTHNTPEVVHSVPTKTVTTHQTVRLVSQPEKSVVVETAPVVENVVKSVQTVPQVNVVKTQVPRRNVVNVVKSLRTSQVPQQVLYYQYPQQQQVLYYQYPQQQQQVVYTQQVPQQVVYTQEQQTPQQWTLKSEVPQQQVVYTQQQPQQVVYTQQVPQQVVRTQVPQQWSVQRRPVTRTTVTSRLANPTVYQLAPSKTVVNRQTVLTGAQLVNDVADESSKSDVVAQEVEPNY